MQATLKPALIQTPTIDRQTHRGFRVFVERPDTGEVAILVHVAIDSSDDQEDPDEFAELVVSAGAEPAAYIHCTRKQPTPGYYVGSGKLDEIADAFRYVETEMKVGNVVINIV